MTYDFLCVFFVMCLANAAISVTISESVFFQGFRDYIFNRAPNGSWFEFLHSLVSCSYCLSHWVAVGLVLLWQPVLPITGSQILDYVIIIFSMVGMTTIIVKLFSK